jgi:hypothetical protein
MSFLAPYHQNADKQLAAAVKTLIVAVTALADPLLKRNVGGSNPTTTWDSLQATNT